MKFSVRVCFSSILFAALLVGCGRNEHSRAPGEYVGGVPLLMDELSNGDVVFIVNGEKYTKRDFRTAVSLADKMRRMCAGDPLTGPNKPAQEYSRWARPRTLSDAFRRVLMRQYTKKNGITPTQEEIDESAMRVLMNLKRGKSTLDAVEKEFGKADGKLFRQYVLDDATEQAARRFVDDKGTLNITDDDVINISNRIARFQARAAASNAVEKAILEKAIAEIAAGKDFAEVAKAYSRDPEQGALWETSYLDEMESSPALMKWASSAKAGDVSGILELDDGWAVVKVVSRRDEDIPPGVIKIPREIWELVRVSRNLFESPPDMDREEIVAKLREFRNKDLQKKIGDLIMKEAVIEWPNGTNLFVKATSAAARKDLPKTKSADGK